MVSTPRASPGDHGDARRCEATGEFGGGLPAVDGGAAGADDGDAPLILGPPLAADVEDGRCVIDLPEATRVSRIAGGERGDAGLLEALHLRVRVDLLLRALHPGRRSRVEARREQFGRAGPPDVLHVGEEAVEQAEAHAPQAVDAVECDTESEVGGRLVGHGR